MHIELLPGLENVVRFPVERRARPTLDLMREIAPDVREVLLVADGFGLEGTPQDLRHAVDRQTAEHILNEVRPEPGEARRSRLEGLLAPLVRTAVEACRASHDASLAAVAMHGRLLDAKTAGSLWTDPLGERADALTLRAAELLVEAHACCEQAEGAARAVGCALRGEAWVPHDSRELGEWLASAGAGRSDVA